MLPSPAELIYFIEACSSLNLSRAAERLGISQPSLSLAIQRLEQTVGTKLLIRHKQGVTLTHAGKQLLLNSRNLLQLWEKTKLGALASQQAVQGYFTLGCHSTIAIYLVANFLPDLLEAHPKLEIHIKNDISRIITERVNHLSIDIGLVVNPLRHPDLVIQKLFDDEVTFWVGEGNRTIQDIYSKDAIILCVPELTQTQFLLSKAKEFGIISDRIITINSIEAMAKLTAKGCGIGIIPERVAHALCPNKLHRIPDAPMHPDEICLIYRHENRNTLAIQTIAATIKKSLNTYG